MVLQLQTLHQGMIYTVTAEVHMYIPEVIHGEWSEDIAERLPSGKVSKIHSPG